MTAAASANTVPCQGVEGQLAVAAGQVQIREDQLGAHSRATPIIESRVTRAASSASVLPSVPCGRWGKTR